MVYCNSAFYMLGAEVWQLCRKHRMTQKPAVM